MSDLPFYATRYTGQEGRCDCCGELGQITVLTRPTWHGDISAARTVWAKTWFCEKCWLKLRAAAAGREDRPWPQLGNDDEEVR